MGLLRQFVPLMVRPKVLTVVNHFKRGGEAKRDLIILGSCAGLVGGFYLGSLWFLRRLIETFQLFYIGPAVFFGLVGLVLFGFLALSGGVSLIGNFFHSKSIDLILASSYRPSRFLVGKICESIFEASWMVLIFFAPVAVAFANFYHGGLVYYLGVLYVTGLLLILALSIASIIVLLFSLAVPRFYYQRIVGAGVLLILCGVAYFVGSNDVSTSRVVSVTTDPGAVMRVFFAPSNWRLPTGWCGYALGELLEPSGRGSLPYMLALSCLTLAAASLNYLLLRVSYLAAYDRVRSTGSSRKIRPLRINLGNWPRHAGLRALLRKEFKIFFRDPSYAFQALLVAFGCMGYLFLLRFLNSTDVVIPGATKNWWMAFLAVFNASAEALLITAICLRFVYPSISLEGESVWVIQAAPLSPREYLRLKFRVWFVLVTAVAVAIFGFGALAFGSPPMVVAIKEVGAVFLCYGMVGLALALGARYANFHWEHPSQLAAGFGNLVYLLLAVMQVTLNLVFVWVPIFLVAVLGPSNKVLGVGFFFFALLVVFNIAVGKLSLLSAERSLEAKFS